MKSQLAVFATVLVVTAALVCASDDETVRPIGGLSFVDEVEVTVVNVDVFVRNSKGDPITGLAVEDFKITQDGIAMPVTNFAELSAEVFRSVFGLLDEPEPTQVTEAPKPVVSREQIKPIYVVLYVDNENLHPLERNRVLRRVREFVNENLHPPVQMMVVAYQRTHKILQTFTDDPQQVNAALRAVQTYTGGRVDRDAARADLVRAMREADDVDYGGNRPSIRENEKQRMYQEVLAFAREETNILSFTLGALRQTLEMMAGLEGRKSLIYVSNGLPMSPGLGLMHDYAITFKDNSIMSHRSQYDRATAFRSLTGIANAQDVTLHTLDAEGLQVRIGGDVQDRYVTDPEASSIGANNYQASLKYMASRTGGIAVVNTNDVSAGLKRVGDDLFTYYSLGYSVSRSGSDKVHHIEVELPEHGDYDLRYRRRFVEKSIETQVQDTVLSSLVFDVQDNPLQLDIEIGKATPGTGDRWMVPVRVTFPLRKVALLPEGEDYVARVVLYVGARDADGRESDLQRQEHEVRVPADLYEESARTRHAIELSLFMAQGQHRVSVGLLDPITRQASFKRVTLTN